MDPRMAATLKEVMRNTLDNFSEVDFKRFKHYLQDQALIPWGRLEKADTDDAVDLMVQVYSMEAGAIMLTILQKMNHNQLAMDLERELGKMGDQQFSPVSCTSISPLSSSFGGAPVLQRGRDYHISQKVQWKKSIQLKLQRHLQDTFSMIHQETGDYRVQDIYSELYIVEGRTGGVHCTHEVSTLNMRQIGRVSSSEDEQVLLGQLFTHRPATKVLTLGIAGVGKTVAVQKFVMDWAEEKTNQDIDFVFVLLFRELNLKKKNQYNLLGLLLAFYTGLRGLKNVDELSECKMLFVLDGLDESKLQLDFENCISELDEKSSVDILIASLISGMLLPSALIWVTTRPAAASLIPRECFNLVTEVRGFNDPQKIEFFQKNVKNPENSNRVINHVKNNRSLHIMCHIPIFCRILASVLEEILDQSKGVPPQTLTEIYTLFSVFQITRMNEKYLKKRNAKEKGQFLVKLGKLAFKHLKNGTLIFYKKDLKKCKLSQKSGALESGVCTQIFKKESAITGENIFSFVHLSVQEFLAALYVLHKGVQWVNPFLKTRAQKMSWLFTHTRFDLYRFAVENALESQNGHLDLFVRFLLGLAPMLEPKIKSPLTMMLPQLAVREVSINKTIQFIKQKIREDISPERIINLFHCLNELGDSSLVEEINRYINLADEERDLTPAQCSALAYLLLMSTEDMTAFDQKNYLRSEEGLNRMLPVVKVSVRVWLNRCNLSKASCKMMASVLQESSRLKELDMSENDLQDEGVELLCVGLRDPQCKLETLRLSQCHLSKASCEMIASVLQRTPSHLRELDMSGNDLHDEGVELLCEGLRDPQCKLKTLRLYQCHISKASCKTMALVLQRTTSYLRELDMSKNDLQDEGVDLLSVGLRDSQCKLETLRLNWCNLSKASCAFMASVLQRTPSHLRELDMSENDLKDKGVELLCVGIRDPQCKLETLRLSACLITHKGYSSLASALKSNPSYLNCLDLSYNPGDPGDPGVIELVGILNDPNCKLETFRHEHGGEYRGKPGLRKYACKLTLDPKTAHRRLFLSQGNRTVTRVSEEQPYPDHPERFDSWEQVLCREGQSERCYWEIECSDDGADIAVAYKGIQRKGEIYSRFECNNKSWSLSCFGNRYTAHHNNKWTAIPAPSPCSNRIAVYLDWPAGTLSFYSVSSDTLTHLHTFHSTFTEPLYPGFRCYNSVSLCQIT
ncbi:NACHT, LRR and PYD domains-containing protein 12-like [Sardina pilchardus]|uniref:NACHT, LRR and PYD domains-containing protein 12-like n=1 Tax=Sardina pilchardus TaxID=27697 RepID=UPI002E0F6A60